MAFEKFHNPKPTKAIERARGARVTVYPRGKLYFNVTAMVQFNQLFTHDYATLYYDRDTNQVGVSLSNEKQDGSYKLATCGNHNRMLQPQAFFKSLGIGVKHAYSTPLSFDAEKKLLVFSGPKPSP